MRSLDYRLKYQRPGAGRSLKYLVGWFIVLQWLFVTVERVSSVWHFVIVRETKHGRSSAVKNFLGLMRLTQIGRVYQMTLNGSTSSLRTVV